MMNFLRNVWPVPVVIFGGFVVFAVSASLIGWASVAAGPNAEHPLVEVAP